jgi:chemotaxis response regulator CheB
LLAKIRTIGRLIGNKTLEESAVERSGAAQTSRRALVAIGASAGGPAALSVLLRSLPPNFPAAIIIIQHVDERFALGMAEWLGQHCALPVRLANEGDHPQAGTVLLAGTGDHLELTTAGQLGYTPEPREYVYRPSIDVFFRSVSLLWPGRAVGVLLTGMGADGAEGLKALRARGHYTIAQDEASSAVYGMPKAAAAANAAMDILPLTSITPKLVHLASHAFRERSC